MSEDIQKESTSPQQEKPPQEGVDGPKPDLQLPPYPKTIVAAGVLLIVGAGLMVLGLVWLFCAVPGGGKSENWWPLVVGPLASVAFLLLGIRFVRATSTVKVTGAFGCGWVGLGLSLALIFGLLALVAWFGLLSGAPAWAPPSADELLAFSFALAWGFLLAALFLSAGVLFLVGRAPYRAWRNAENARKENGPPKEGDA